jgi:hypothetical protein
LVSGNGSRSYGAYDLGSGRLDDLRHACSFGWVRAISLLVYEPIWPIGVAKARLLEPLSRQSSGMPCPMALFVFEKPRESAKAVHAHRGGDAGGLMGWRKKQRPGLVPSCFSSPFLSLSSSSLFSPRRLPAGDPPDQYTTISIASSTTVEVRPGSKSVALTLYEAASSPLSRCPGALGSSGRGSRRRFSVLKLLE